MLRKINLRDKFTLFDTHWDPKIVGNLNNQLVKLVKFKGEFVWHKHENEDELFFVVDGTFDMQLRDQVVTINKEEFIIIPRGTEHRPVAKQEVKVLLFEPESTINTGDEQGALTKTELDNI
jgi:mannose-6-phosphate isomerase-like protein (cupin superfamily)